MKVIEKNFRDVNVAIGKKPCAMGRKIDDDIDQINAYKKKKYEFDRFF